MPGDADGARRWLRQHARHFTAALRNAAEQIAVGIDADVWPYQYEAGHVGRSRVRVVCSAMRHLDARELARYLTQWSERWEPLLDELAPLLSSKG